MYDAPVPLQKGGLLFHSYVYDVFMGGELLFEPLRKGCVSYMTLKKVGEHVFNFLNAETLCWTFPHVSQL